MLSATSLRTGPPKKVVDELVHRFETFPKFETVADCSDHKYVTSESGVVSASLDMYSIQPQFNLFKNIPMICGTGTKEMGKENTRRMEGS